MVDIETETKVRGSIVSDEELSTSGSNPVWGVAIGNDETTRGMSGTKKFWPEAALRDAADTLQGKNLVKNHVNNDVDAVVGSVTEARHHPEYGVIYKGELDDEELAQKVERERLDVSPRIKHKHVEELEENDDGALVVDEIVEFANLAIVPRGAAESNKIRIGESGILSHSELRAEFGDAADDPQQDDKLDIEDPVGGEDLVSAELGDWDSEQLADISVHEPSYSGTTSSEWSKPSEEDFDTDDLSEIDDHFIVSKDGFPPENYGDLALPVVEPSGELNTNGVESARQMASQVDGLTGDDLDRVEGVLSNLPPSEDEEEMAGHDDTDVDQENDVPGAEEKGDRVDMEGDEEHLLSEIEVLGVDPEKEIDISEIEILTQ